MSASLASPKAGMEPSPANIQLMQLTNAFWTSRCLHVVAELGVADHLGDQPQSTESLARATGTRPDPLHRVLRLLASVGIFEWKDGTWHHTEASRFLRTDDPGSLRDYVRMIGLPIFWSAFEDLDHSLRTGEAAFTKRHSGGVFAYLAKHQEESRIFDAAMTSKSHRDIAASCQLMISPNLRLSRTSPAGAATCCAPFSRVRLRRRASSSISRMWLLKSLQRQVRSSR